MYDGDVALRLTNDGGMIKYSNGQPILDAGGLENAVLISLFTREGWHGNALDENFPEKQIQSDFESYLDGRPSSRALRYIEDSGRRALAWLVDLGVAREVLVTATAPERNRVNIIIEVFKPDQTDPTRFKYALNWTAGAAAGPINTGVS